MSAILKPKDLNILRRFIPLNTLADDRFQELIDGLSIEQVAKGSVIFEQGDEKKEFIYLISGSIALYAGQMEMESIATGSEAARFAIAHQLPRKVKGVAKTKLKIVRIPSNKLDQDKAKDVTSTYMVDEPSNEGGDWMATMLQSPVFQRLPAANLQKVMIKMEEVVFLAGETVVKQGDPADYYYIIKRGTCELTRQSSKSAKPIKLAELHDCASFGEDALLSDAPRNVTVTMKGDGQLLRLTKEDFITLVKEPVLQYLEYADAEKKVKEGAAWLDVREVEAYQNGHIDDSINIPFFSLRMKISSLKHDQVQLLVCEQGRTSEAAAFLLLKFGFNAYILKGGMESLANARKQDTKVESQTGHDTVPLVVEESGDESLKEGSLAGLLEEAQQQIADLEKLCAAVNEEQNKVSLERDAIQKDRDRQLALVKASNASIASYKEQIEALEKSQLTYKVSNEKELKMAQKRVQELEALERQSAESQQQLTLVEQEKAALAEELQNEKAKLAKVEKGLLEHVVDTENLQKQNEALQRQLTTKDEHIEQQKNALANAQQNMLSAEQEIAKRVLLVEEEREQLKLEKEALEADVQVINENMTALKAENNELKEAFDNIKQSEGKGNEKLKDELETLTHAKQQVDQLIVELEGRYQTVYEESGVLKQELASKQTLLDERAQETNGLQEQLKEAKELERVNDLKLQDLSAKNKDLHMENTLLLEGAEQQQKTLSEVQAALIKSQQEQSILKDEYEALVHKLENMDLALSTDNKEHAEALAERDSLSEDLERLKKEKEENKRTVEKLNQANNDLQQELESARAVIEGFQVEIDSIRTSNVSLKDELVNSKQLLQDLQGTIDMLSADKQSMEDSFKQQLTEVQNQLIHEKEATSVANKLLEDAKSDAQNSSSSLQQLTDKMQQLSDEKEADMERLNSLQESLTILEASLERSKEEKKQLELSLVDAKEAKSIEANRVIALEAQLSEEKLTIEENNKQLTLSLQASQKEVGDLSLKLDELLDIKAAVENENSSLEQKVVLYEQNKQALTENIKMLESKLSLPDEKEQLLLKIQSLEQQLVDARTALMDKEVELANIDSAVNDTISSEGGELLALKSELLLVREQTESDIKAMQEMLESSAKMNLALKKELLALQATTYQMADNEQPKKKKGLWK